MGRFGTVQPASRMVIVSYVNRLGRSGILYLWAAVGNLSDGYAMAISVVALPSGGLCGLQYLSDERSVVHVSIGVVYKVAGFEARRFAPTSTSLAPILRHDSRRICGGWFLGAFWDCLQD